MECFELAVPANFVSYAPTFFGLLSQYLAYKCPPYHNPYLWWPISAITCQIIMSTCHIFMLTCQLFMLTCQILMSTCQKNITTTSS